MSMILDLFALTDEAIDALAENPEFVNDYLIGRVPDPGPPAPPRLIDRLLGRTTEPPPSKPVPQILRRRIHPSESLDKTWHGLHFLLTGKAGSEDGPDDAENEEAVADDPAYWLIYGGILINQDLGYGPPHAFKSSDVKRYAVYLDTLDDQTLSAAFAPQKMEELGIYCGDWVGNSDEELNWLIDSFHTLKKFVQTTAKENLGLLIVLC